jgi:hypothetical protein
LTVYRKGRRRTTELGSVAELRHAVETELAMPRCPVEKAVEALARITGRNSR